MAAQEAVTLLEPVQIRLVAPICRGSWCGHSARLKSGRTPFDSEPRHGAGEALADERRSFKPGKRERYPTPAADLFFDNDGRFGGRRKIAESANVGRRALDAAVRVRVPPRHPCRLKGA